MNVHDGDYEYVIVQEAGLLADSGGRIQPGGIDRQNPNAEKRDFLYRLTEAFQCLHLARMVAKSEGDAGRFPTERLHSFEGHQSMGDLAKDVCRSNAANLLVFDTFKELCGGGPKRTFGSKWWMKTL